MHKYCSGHYQEECKKKVTKALIVIAVLLTPAVNNLLKVLSLLAHNVWLIGSVLNYLMANGMSFAVSYVGLFSFFYWLLDHFFWVSPISKALRVPNLKGIWIGQLHTNSGGGKSIYMELHIKQTWSEIACTAIFKESSSSSQMARVYRLNDQEVQLEFAYANQSGNPDVLQRMYHGYNWLTVKGDKMIGCYFTDRVGEDGKNTTHGSMDLIKRHSRIYELLHHKVKK